MEDIINYLREQAPDYQHGVNLLRKHHKNRNLVNGLQRKESDSNVAKLRYELAKLAGDQSLATLPLALEVASEPKEDTSPQNEDSSAPDDDSSEPSLAALATELPAHVLAAVEHITQEMGKVHNQKAALSNQLGDCESRADRFHVVQEIQQLEDKYNQLAQDKQRTIEVGAQLKEPTVVEEAKPVVDEASLVRSIANVRSNLSKARKRYEEAKSEAKRTEYAEKVAKLSAELEEMELSLKALRA